jgi:hypothetical protein
LEEATMSERQPMRLVPYARSSRTALVPRVHHPLPVPTVPAARAPAPLYAIPLGRAGGGARAARATPRDRAVVIDGAAASRPAPAGGADARWVRLSVATAGLATVFSLLALLK